VVVVFFISYVRTNCVIHIMFTENWKDLVQLEFRQHMSFFVQ
jgi:hypothetical protein